MPVQNIPHSRGGFMKNRAAVPGGMTTAAFLAGIFTFFSFLPAGSAGTYWVTAYYGAGNKVMPVSAIPWSKYTEVNHFAAAPGENGTVSLHYLTQEDIKEFVTAAHAAKKKALVTIMDGGPGFIDATNSAHMTNFIANIKDFVFANGYDGVDIDWEGKVESTQYVELFSRLRAALGPTRLITIATGNWNGLETVAALGQKFIDHINIMTYDMDMESFTWHNDALFQNGDSSKMTADWRVSAFIKAGVEKKKLGIGVPFYGRRWTGACEPLDKNGVRQEGWVNYRDLAADSTRWRGAYRKWDSVFSADYISDIERNEFTSYNGVRSIRETARWIKEQGFGGIFSFILDYEYIGNGRGDDRYPLSTAIWRNMAPLQTPAMK